MNKKLYIICGIFAFLTVSLHAKTIDDLVSDWKLLKTRDQRIDFCNQNKNLLYETFNNTSLDWATDKTEKDTALAARSILWFNVYAAKNIDRRELSKLEPIAGYLGFGASYILVKGKKFFLAIKNNEWKIEDLVVQPHDILLCEAFFHEFSYFESFKIEEYSNDWRTMRAYDRALASWSAYQNDENRFKKYDAFRGVLINKKDQDQGWKTMYNRVYTTWVELGTALAIKRELGAK